MFLVCVIAAFEEDACPATCNFFQLNGIILYIVVGVRWNRKRALIVMALENQELTRGELWETYGTLIAKTPESLYHTITSLIKQDFLYSTGENQSSGGRPPKTLCATPKAKKHNQTWLKNQTVRLSEELHNNMTKT